ncbi:MAG: hypothetical protein MI862_05140 [Desulfobacterales bacterium]|nr:hypothetical protein [Desulfobacterales bacterium]
MEAVCIRSKKSNSPGIERPVDNGWRGTRLKWLHFPSFNPYPVLLTNTQHSYD